MLQHKKIDKCKINNVKELHHFFKKYDFRKYDFRACSFDAAHDYHNNLDFCIYCRFNCMLMKFADIMCICPDLFF